MTVLAKTSSNVATRPDISEEHTVNTIRAETSLHSNHYENVKSSKIKKRLMPTASKYGDGHFCLRMGFVFVVYSEP
jgi:hypothetical protein